jgi:hypothetical protein
VGRLPVPRAAHRLVPKAQKLVRKLRKAELPLRFASCLQTSKHFAKMSGARKRRA